MGCNPKRRHSPVCVRGICVLDGMTDPQRERGIFLRLFREGVSVACDGPSVPFREALVDHVEKSAHGQTSRYCRSSRSFLFVFRVSKV